MPQAMPAGATDAAAGLRLLAAAAVVTGRTPSSLGRAGASTGRQEGPTGGSASRDVGPDVADLCKTLLVAPAKKQVRR